jgi:tetratricopeptide (TPR) repeat protein
MKHFKVRVLIVSLGLGICPAFLFAGAALGQSCGQWGGKIVSVQGVVQVQKVGESSWMAVGLNATYCPGDMIRVLKNSRAAIVLSNETLFRLDQNTTVTFTGVEKEKTFLIEILKGVTHFFSRQPRKLQVVTPFLNAAVEGTEFYVRVAQDKTFMSIFEGRVAVTNKAGSLVLTGGQSAVAEAGKAPVLRVVVKPRDAVQWALYYLPVMYVQPGDAPKEDMSDPRFLAYRASQLLAVGRVDEAGADIELALSLNPKYSDAFALQSIIAVVQNEKDKALGAAQKAIETGPNSATAHIAMSYAQQAGFDLEGARTSVEEAVKLDPNNALAWARLAELWSSFGRLGKALDAAKKAIDLDPSLARTQMVLGFAYLTQVKTTASRAAFEKAIELDQADPLSRLGLGLAKIRDGDLQAGGREIEIAASLDPNNSIVRSYLGKTYYEEKRTKLDEQEYAIAKELDPNDPTPWFYDAIAKQTTNRPVEALHNLQKAIELNDNRAVYRSKLMLDADLAARSAAIARVYSDLGFQQRALVEGWNSVNTDPTNFSAHRFLADSYSVRPRHEIARVSELLQSQLLQPLNINPIQPRLAESNQFLLSGGGPAGLSFNEFNPLFNRNRIAVQGIGLAGENETQGAEGVVSGIYKRLSFSGGYTHFETDGWRDNADQNDDIANVFAQYELSYKTSIQAEYRYRDTESGDLPQRFFKDEFLPNFEEDEERHSIRLGFHHAFEPGSDLIGNFQYTKGDFSQHFEDPDPDFTFPIFNFDLEADDDEDIGGELSYLLRSKYLNLVSGAGYFGLDSKDEITIFLEFPDPPPLVLDQFEADNDVKHTNLYAYSYIKPLENLTLTIGASYDDFNPDDDDEFKDKNQFNPKFGIAWNPSPNTTLRAAAFRVLKRTLITDQTLEPTQVAGFNQFFDEIDATDYWVYGGALDQKFTNVFLGAEYTYRDLDVPFNDLTAPSPNLITVDWDEQIFRAYLFWTPHQWLALNAEYIYEDLDRDKNYNLNAKTVETHYLPLGIKFFHPSGLSASLKGTYVNQEGSFNRLDAPLGVTEDGEDDFWLFDAAIRYRFPKRYGFLTAGVSNLTDEDFEYYDTDPDNPRIQPDRFFFVKVTLALP